MDDSHHVAAVASLIGDRARATMLMSLMSGRSLTATELARAAGVTKQTASSHLSKLLAARLVSMEREGRHRYVRLSDPDVAAALEALTGIAGRVTPRAVVPGPSDPGLRRARVCYDHLAGELGVLVFDGLQRRGVLRVTGKKVTLTERSDEFFGAMGIDLAALEHGRRPLCLSCLDWSARRPHLAGALGAAILDRIFTLGWARRDKKTRLVSFSALGERSLRSRFG
jgi:DNA-binding transcriptional ArsR family regulator